MFSPSSNRNNSTIVDYYHTFADLIGIFWQFHNERIRSGNIPFAAVAEGGDSHKIVPFSPQKLLSRPKPEFLYPIVGFTDSAWITMASSFEQFLDGNGIKVSPFHLLDHVQVPESTKRFFDPFVNDKIKKAVTLNEEVHPIPQDLLQDKSKEEISELEVDGFARNMRGGMSTGVSVPTQLRFLFGEEFKPFIAIALSNIAIEYLEEARKGIGIKSELSEASPSYTLLDNSSLGLDITKLQEWRIGDTLGCPAAMKVSPEAESFLAQRGMDVSHTTMLLDFTRKLPGYVDGSLGVWFRGLNSVERARIAPSELAVMTGRARRRVLEANAIGCHYGKER